METKDVGVDSSGPGANAEKTGVQGGSLLPPLLVMMEQLAEKRLKRRRLREETEEVEEEIKACKRRRLENPIHARVRRLQEEADYVADTALRRTYAQKCVDSIFGDDKFADNEEAKNGKERWLKNAYQTCSVNVPRAREKEYNLIGKHDIYIRGRRLVYVWGPTKQLVVAAVQDNAWDDVDVYDPTPYALKLLDASAWKNPSTLDADAEAQKLAAGGGDDEKMSYSDDSGDDDLDDDDDKSQKPVRLCNIVLLDYEDRKLWTKSSFASPDDYPSGDPSEWSDYVVLAGCFLAGGVDQGCTLSSCLW